MIFKESQIRGTVDMVRVLPGNKHEYLVGFHGRREWVAHDLLEAAE